MPKTSEHPNEPGKWTLLEQDGSLALWRRERSDPVPVTMFYVVAPPRQSEVAYVEAQARSLFDKLSSRDAGRAA